MSIVEIDYPNSNLKIKKNVFSNTLDADKITLTSSSIPAPILELNATSANPFIELSKGDDLGFSLSNQKLTPTTAELNGFGLTDYVVSNTVYGTNGLVKNTDSDNGFGQVINSCDSQNFFIGSSVDACDGGGTIKRVFTGFYNNVNPSIGAYSGNSLETLTSDSLLVNSDLNLQTLYSVQNVDTVSCTTLSPTLIDASNGTGTNGQILSSTGSGVQWIDSPTASWVGTATSDLNMGNTYNIVGAKSIDNSGNTMTVGSNTTTLTTGKPTGTNNIQGYVQFSGQSGTIGQCLQSNGVDSTPTWVTPYISNSTGVSTGNIDMGEFDIKAVANVYNNANTGLTLGIDTKPTNITGHVQFGGSAGTSGQYLKSNGTNTTPSWDTLPASTWVGTATSNLDMGNLYDIVRAKSLDNNGAGVIIGATVSDASGVTIGKSTATTTVNGTLNAGTIDRAGTINIGTTSGTSIDISRSGQTTTINGTLATATIDRAGTIDIGTASGTSIGIGRATQTTTINGTLNAGTIDRGGTINIGTTNGTSIGIGRATQTTTINGTLATATIDRAGTIGIGETNATTITIGKTTAPTSTTNVRGIVQFNGQAGTSGQYLKSNGSGSVPTWDTPPSSSWVGTATSNLDMASVYDIQNARSITNNAGVLTVGSGTVTLNSGSTTGTNNIRGFVQFQGQAGTSGQVLQSNGSGSVPTWVTPVSTWVGNATSNLVMANAYDIIGAKVINNAGSTLAVGSTTTLVTTGNTTGTNNIQGFVQFQGQAGTSGQVLQSNGTGTVPTWVTLSSAVWNGTATSNLNMGGIYDIIGARSINNSGGSLAIGATTTDITFGQAGTSSTFNGGVITQTVDSTGFLEIGTSTATSITIGNMGNTTINGTGIVGGMTMTVGSISNCTSVSPPATSSMSFCSSQTSGILNVGTLSNRSGAININTGATSSANTSIMTGASATGTLSLGGGTSVVRTNRPIDLNYNPTAISTTAGSNQLGFQFDVIYTGNTPNGSPVQIARGNLTSGVWLAQGNARFTTPGAGGFYGLSISATDATMDNSCRVGMSTQVNTAVGANLSRIIKVTATTQLWYLVAFTPISCPMESVVFNVFRIA